MGARNLDKCVLGPTLTLAASVKAALEAAQTDVDLEWGVFYVRRVELACYSSGVTEIVGYLVPDEAEGKTFDLYTPEKPEVSE